MEGVKSMLPKGIPSFGALMVAVECDFTRAVTEAFKLLRNCHEKNVM